MAEYTRLLTFHCKNLGIDSVFVLSFDNEKIPGIYKDVFPTIFKVTIFGAKGHYKFNVLYNSKLGFTRAQLYGEVVVSASTYTPIDPGQETTLSKRGKLPLYSFSTPTAITPPSDQLVVVNGTSGRENIGFGFFEAPDSAPTQVLVFEGVGAGSAVQAEFTPILRGYMTSTQNYDENILLRRRISSPFVFEKDLVQLPENTAWRVTYNEGTGAYNISRFEHLVEDEI